VSSLSVYDGIREQLPLETTPFLQPRTLAQVTLLFHDTDNPSYHLLNP
jgi:hypothetical protein